MFKQLIRPLSIPASFAIGFLLPVLGEFSWAVRYILMVMLYFVFLQLEIKELVPKRSHFVLLLFNLILPVVFWAVFYYSGNRELAEAAFFTAVTPTATAAPVIIKFLGGQVSYVVNAFVISTAGVAVLLPVMLPLMITGEVKIIGFVKVILNLLILVGIPWGSAALTRRIYPASLQWPKKAGNFSFGLWVVLLCIVSANAINFIRNQNSVRADIFLMIAAITFLICVMNFVFGYLAGEKELRREASQSSGQKNTSFTIVLATMFGTSPLAAIGPTFYLVWHNLWNAFQLFMHDRKKL